MDSGWQHSSYFHLLYTAFSPRMFFFNHHMKFSIYTKFTMWKLLRVTINMGAEVKCESLPHTQCCAVNFHYHAKKIVPKENTDYPCSCNV